MFPVRAFAVVVLLSAALLPACERRSSRGGRERAPTSPEMNYKPAVNETFGVAVAILLDTSGSMGDPVPGSTRTKDLVAREAIGSMLEATGEFMKEHPDRKVKVALLHFSGTVSIDLDVTDYDPGKVRMALQRIPAPDGRTAIGSGLDEARKELYRSGCLSKHILVITDGENTAGVEPEEKAREIQRRSENQVKFHFVAFDTDPEKFGFLNDIGGTLLPAKNADQLSAALKEIYEDKILAEAMAEEE